MCVFAIPQTQPDIDGQSTRSLAHKYYLPLFLTAGAIDRAFQFFNQRATIFRAISSTYMHYLLLPNSVLFCLTCFSRVKYCLCFLCFSDNSDAEKLEMHKFDLFFLTLTTQNCLIRETLTELWELGVWLVRGLLGMS